MYDEDIKNMRDIYATTMFERKMARKEGRAEQQNASARMMIKEGLALELVCKCTGLTIDQVKKLKGN